MASTLQTNQFGLKYKWGFFDSDAPVITGFAFRSAQLRFEPEVMINVREGMGNNKFTVTTKPQYRKIVATFVAYILDGYQLSNLPDAFIFSNRTYIITGISYPKQRGQFHEISIETESSYFVGI